MPAGFGSVIDSDANTSGEHFPSYKFAVSQGSHLVSFRQVPIGSGMSVSKAYIQLGYFTHTEIDGLKQWDCWRRREGDISNNDVSTTFVKRFYGDGDPQLWARQPYSAFMVHLWFSQRSSACCNYPFLYILNVLTCFASSAWAWCHILETEGRMSKTQNTSRELMKRDFCICWNGKGAYLWADKTSL